MYLRKMGAVQPSQHALYRRMKSAIAQIESAYQQSLKFDGADQLRRQELDRMDLYSLETIAAWESGWLTLLSNLRRLK